MTKPVSPGDIVQIGSHHHWPGCLVVVDTVAPWGVIAYMQVPLGNTLRLATVIPENRAYIRLDWDDFVETGGKVPS